MIRVNGNASEANWTGEANGSTCDSDHHGFRSKLKLSGSAVPNATVKTVSLLASTTTSIRPDSSKASTLSVTAKTMQ